MAKRQDIRKVMIIGSGPIIIGQACEFDYSGTQACKALRQEGYEVVLVNSNPATIMTDPRMADELCKCVELRNVWECACGAGHLAKVFDRYGLLGRASDIVDRGYGESGVDFLLQTEPWNGDIVTNPPYKYPFYNLLLISYISYQITNTKIL